MPTILTHAAIPLALGFALGPRRISRKLLIAGMLASMMPDLDVIGLKLGIEYGDQFGHRGASHSIVFALALGMLAALFAPWLHAGRRTAAAFVAFACVSHPLLDMCTTGGLGAALWWPLSEQRMFFAAQLIKVSPLTADRFFGPGGVAAIKSEILWVWLPCCAVMLAAWDRRTQLPSFHVTQHGVFKPIAMTRELGLYAIGAALALFYHFAGNGHLLGAVGMFVAMAIMRCFQMRKLGPDGEPIVAVLEHTLLFRNPGFRQTVEAMPLAEIDQLKVYGQQGNRHYRFLLAGQDAKDLSLMQNKDAEQAVIAFLEKTLPGKVIVAKAPQTFFEKVRGEQM
ncbi:hypothetical protein GM658_03085 [Pseudoduganella eburnea]|uniref:Metal-dependent hydrolase n=1 Tax=Massilia eburnea TaxID=1776165 RepID=A0A6L6QC21_9BURK|nr:metal-dependent hydrolase [Massilia eburnea]MTW09574.1 hypothetical protein [Massilia eburnea]